MVSRGILAGGYYRSNVVWTLAAGTYRLAVDFFGPTQKYATFSSTSPQTFAEGISDVQQVFMVGTGAYPSQFGAADIAGAGQLFLSTGGEAAALSIDGKSTLAATIGGVEYPIAGPLHSAGGRWNPSAGGQLYTDGQFQLYWDPTSDQFEYELSVSSWWGSTNVVVSCESLGGKAAEVNAGAFPFLEGVWYRFSTGTIAADYKHDLSPGRTARLTICSGDASMAGAPIIEITAMRTATVILWSLRRHTWDVDVAP